MAAYDCIEINRDIDYLSDLVNDTPHESQPGEVSPKVERWRCDLFRRHDDAGGDWFLFGHGFRLSWRVPVSFLVSSQRNKLICRLELRSKCDLKRAEPAADARQHVDCTPISDIAIGHDDGGLLRRAGNLIRCGPRRRFYSASAFMAYLIAT